MDTNKKILWKKKIKFLQIFILIGLCILYFSWNFFNSKKLFFNKQEKEYTAKKLELTNLLKEKNNIELLANRIKEIKASKKEFITAYNRCYFKYIYGKYVYSGNNNGSEKLIDCIYNNGYNKSYIRNMSDEDLEKVVMGLGVLKNTNKKLLFPQNKILYSLDRNIFSDNLEKNVEMLTFGLPKLENKDLNLYSVNFSMKMLVNYSMLLNVLYRLQNQFYLNKPIYYTINSMSSFDVTNINYQDILIQGKVYFRQ